MVDFVNQFTAVDFKLSELAASTTGTILLTSTCTVVLYHML